MKYRFYYNHENGDTIDLRLISENYTDLKNMFSDIKDEYIDDPEAINYIKNKGFFYKIENDNDEELPSIDIEESSHRVIRLVKTFD